MIKRTGFRPLQSLVAGWRPADGTPLEPLEAILLAWTGIVGGRVAQHSQPLELHDGVLVVATRSSAWSQQLQFLEPEILARLRAMGGPALTGLRFRSGRLRPPKPAGAERSVVRRPRPAAAEGPLCAPCRGERARRRKVDLERLFFNLPWLDAESLVSLVPGLEPGELEAIRRGLLQRWWLGLERVRRGSRRATDHERRIASSYVLLQSGLAPDDITPAVVRNVLGPDLEARLFGSPGSAPSAAKEDER